MAVGRKKFKIFDYDYYGEFMRVKFKESDINRVIYHWVRNRSAEEIAKIVKLTEDEITVILIDLQFRGMLQPRARDFYGRLLKK